MTDVLSLLPSLVRKCTELSLYFAKAQDVDFGSAVFGQDILDLERVLSSIHESVRIVGSSVLTLRTGQSYWENVAISLVDCMETLEALDRLIRSPRRVLQFARFLGLKKDEVTLDWNSEEIRAFFKRR
jgi:hypothetical protein